MLERLVNDNKSAWLVVKERKESTQQIIGNQQSQFEVLKRIDENLDYANNRLGIHFKAIVDELDKLRKPKRAKSLRKKRKDR